MKTILVPVDLSDVAPTVCDTACALARVMKARVLLLHVVQPPAPMLTDMYALDAGQSEEMLVAAENAGREQLETLAARCTRRGVPVRTLQRVGVPVLEILERAAKADYVVVGSHGHGAMYDLLVGSTTRGVLKRAPCPVVVVPPPKPHPRP